MNIKDMKEYVIENDELKLTVLNYGAIITGIYTKDKKGNKENVVAAFQHKEDYVQKPEPYLNAVVGPTAGRIAYGTYELDGKMQQLSLQGVHHLHGGNSGISMKLFDVEKTKDCLHFHLETTHEEDGYPKGIVVYDVIYKIQGNRLIMDFYATPQSKMPLYMTSHLYFNLSGDLKRDITSQTLYMDALKKVKIAKEGHPYKVMDIEKGSTFDFTTPRLLQDILEKDEEEYTWTKGLDMPFILTAGVIEMHDEQSGRHLKIETTAPSVVVYSANFFDDSFILNQGKQAEPYLALALEPQEIPNSLNLDGINVCAIHDKQHPFTQKTVYTFTTDAT